jgi:hypothetical protein
MKNYSLLITLVVCYAFGLMPSPSYSQGRTLTAQQLDAIVKPSSAQCQLNGARIDAASIIPTRNAREFPADRIAKTLHGIWQGRIIGDDNDLGVDYFWIVDTKNNEGLIIALRNGKQTVAGPREAATAPKLTFLLCPNEGYTPSTDTPLIHEFVKVADSIDDAPRILQKATRLKLSKERPSLSNLWQGLLTSGYFKSMPAVAFAGALFKPIQIGRVANATGPAGVLLRWDAEYRGGGSTGIKYSIGVPMIGVEHGEFIGTTTNQGDFLVSSAGNGKIWKVEASSVATSDSTASEEGSRRTFPAVCYDLAFDKVVLGPLQ